MRLVPHLRSSVFDLPFFRALSRAITAPRYFLVAANSRQPGRLSRPSSLESLQPSRSRRDPPLGFIRLSATTAAAVAACNFNPEFQENYLAVRAV